MPLPGGPRGGRPPRGAPPAVGRGGRVPARWQVPRRVPRAVRNGDAGGGQVGVPAPHRTGAPFSAVDSSTVRRTELRSSPRPGPAHREQSPATPAVPCRIHELANARQSPRPARRGTAGQGVRPGARSTGRLSAAEAAVDRLVHGSQGKRPGARNSLVNVDGRGQGVRQARVPGVGGAGQRSSARLSAPVRI